MSKAFVKSVLAVLLISVHSTLAFPSNIHEKMTRAERLAVFGSEDSVPEYRVFPMSLPGARRRRETDESIKLTIEVNGKTFNLNLKPTTGWLATKYTPVWSANSDKHAYRNIRYDPLPTAMSDIGEFKMYHDVENEAAVTVYTDSAEGSIIEGIWTPYYAIRSLPKRLVEEVLQPGDNLIWQLSAKKRSITSDATEDTGHFVVFKVSGAPNYVAPSTIADLNNLRREKRVDDKGGERKRPKAVYPEILLVLDHNAIRDHTIAQALRYMLAFWNGVDLIYRRFREPKVRLNIAGIIIAADNWATPYIASDVSVNKIGNAGFILSEMGKYFYEEEVRFPMNGYDMIIAMTTIGICGVPPIVQGESCLVFLEYANGNTSCPSEREISRMKTIKNNGIVGYNFKFTGIIMAARALAHIFGAESETVNGVDGECPWDRDHVMAKLDHYNNWSFKWSDCSQLFLSHYFSSEKSTCLDNKPLWRKIVGEVLPGRWMSRDGQCQNEGFAKACRGEEKGMCQANRCRNQYSAKCIRTKKVPLPGTECGSNKYCSTKNKCVRNSWVPMNI